MENDLFPWRGKEPPEFIDGEPENLSAELQGGHSWLRHWIPSSFLCLSATQKLIRYPSVGSDGFEARVIPVLTTTARATPEIRSTT